MLIAVRYLDHTGSYNYAPPVRDGLVDADEVIRATPTTSERGSGPHLILEFSDGKIMTIVSTAADFLAAVKKARTGD